MTVHPHVGTIGSTIARGFKMWISCDAIGYRNTADLNLTDLRDRLGTDYPVVDFVARANAERGRRAGGGFFLFLPARPTTI
jgi:hypothetical protein